jgi:hypothetical protein
MQATAHLAEPRTEYTDRAAVQYVQRLNPDLPVSRGWLPSDAQELVYAVEALADSGVFTFPIEAVAVDSESVILIVRETEISYGVATLPFSVGSLYSSPGLRRLSAESLADLAVALYFGVLLEEPYTVR